MSTNVQAFLDAREQPYTLEHVQDIEKYATEQGIPFCDECKDWHFPDEQHSG